MEYTIHGPESRKQAEEECNVLIEENLNHLLMKPKAKNP
jgi:hypothetical protein